MGSPDRFWPRRLRWRFRGAWQWPTFALLTLVDGLILHYLAPVGDAPDVFFGVIVASFGNLFLLGVVAPFIARRLAKREAQSTPGGPAFRRASETTPLEVLQDRAATMLLAAGAVGLLAAGLAARPLVVSETEATERNAELVSQYVRDHAGEEVRRNRDTANTIRLADDYFRTCIALDDRTRAYCMFVDINSTPSVRVDPNPAPNPVFLERRGRR